MVQAVVLVYNLIIFEHYSNFDTEMKVWKDVFSGDELVSDSYKMVMIHNDACLEVQAKFVTKGNDNI